MTVRVNFSGVSGLQSLVPQMDRAEKRTVDIRGIGSDNQFRSIVNLRTNAPACVVTDDYKIVQHQDFFQGVAEYLSDERIGIKEGTAYFSNNGNKISIRAIFDGVQIHENGKGLNIQTGGQFTNSYDSNSGAKGAAYFMRMSCYNQMVLSNVVEGTNFCKAHNAKSETALMDRVYMGMQNFVDNLMGGINHKVEAQIEAAQAKIVTFENIEQIEATLGGIFHAKRHSDAISRELMDSREPGNEGLTFSHWDIYNAATDYASHNVKLPIDVQEDIMRAAEVKVFDVRRGITPFEFPAVAPALAAA